MDNVRASIDILFRKISPDLIFEHYFDSDLNKNPLSEDVSNDFFSRSAISNLQYYSDDEVNNIYCKLNNEWLKNKNGRESYLNRGVSVFNLLRTFSKEVLTEIDDEPCCRYNNFLRWREMSHLVGEDIFTTSFLASQDILANYPRNFFCWKPIISTDNIRLRKMLNKGMAENHFHLTGSGPIFDLSWISLMNNITGRDGDFKKLGQDKLQEELVHKSNASSLDMHVLIKKAAFIRAFLFKTLNDIKLNKDIPATAAAADVLAHTKLNLLLSHPSNPEDSSILNVYLGDIQKEIDLLQYDYGYRFRFKECYHIPDYAIRQNLTEDNFNGNILLFGERRFMYEMFKEIYKFGKSIMARYHDLFYAYLAIRNHFADELVQINHKVGFGNFKKYQDRKSIFIPKNSFYEMAVCNMAVKSSLQNQKIQSLEARFAPPDNKDGLILKINDYDKWIMSNIFMVPNFDPNLLAFEQIINSRKAENQSQRPVQAKEENFFYTLHYGKRRDKPVHNGKQSDEQDLLTRLIGSLKSRHYRLREQIKKQSLAIAELQESLYDKKQRIYGIDAASAEIGCRPEVMGQAFRYLKNHKNNKEYDTLREKKKINKLYASYHVGEDFLDIVDGLRAIDEAVKFCNLTQGDRIGHALALGIDVEEFYDYKNRKLLIPKQDLLDNIVWLLAKIREFNINEFGSLVETLLKQYNNFFYEIYVGSNETNKKSGNHNCQIDFNNIPHTIYYDAWKLRGDDPALYSNKGEYNNNNKHQNLTFWQRCGENDCCPENPYIRENIQITNLYFLYHYDCEVRKRGEVIYEYKIEQRYIDAIKVVQQAMQKKIVHLGIGVETNPSSNYLIGTFKRYDKHPIINLFNLGLTADQDKLKSCPQMFVSINTDDQGVFETYLENEYALLAIALEKAKDENGEPLYNQAMIYDWLDRIRQMGIEQSFKK